MARNNFKEQNRVGKAGEAEFIKFAESMNWVVEDVSDNPDYQKVDTDFIVTNKKGESKLVEVKWDKRIAETGNMFCETISHCYYANKGWLHFSDADEVWYGCATTRTFYVVKLDDLREYVKKYKPYQVVFNDYENNKKVKGALVNLFDFKEKGYKVATIILS